jgi:hypothetical protein
MEELVISVTWMTSVLSTRLTAVMTEAAKCIPFPGSSCKLPGRKMVAVGYGDGSGGAEDVGDAFPVESCAATQAHTVRRGKMEGNLIQRASIVR